MDKFRGTLRAFCARYCKYYKPGKDEALSCRAYQEVCRLGLMDSDIGLRHKDNHTAYGAVMDALRRSFCTKCDFYADDCDFISSEGACPPCGGLLVLAELITSGRLRMDDVK